MATNNDEGLGAVRLPAATFSERLRSALHRDEARLTAAIRHELIQLELEDLILIRDALHREAIHRAGCSPKDNHLVRHLFTLAHLFSDLADVSS
jgi:hypothetical protein